MKYSCSPEGVEQLTNTVQRMNYGEETIRSETSLIQDIADEYRNVIGPHANKLEAALNEIAAQVNKSANAINEVEEYLNSIAQKYQEIIDENPFNF